MSDFTVGEPTEVPPLAGRSEGKHTELFAKVRALQNGQALPLEFADIGIANKWAFGKYGNFRKQGVRIQRRGTTVYLTRLEDQS